MQKFRVQYPGLVATLLFLSLRLKLQKQAEVQNEVEFYEV